MPWASAAEARALKPLRLNEATARLRLQAPIRALAIDPAVPGAAEIYS
jgi:hypothetical protein